MARDWLQIARRIEAAYPRAAGGPQGDEGLRAQLVPWARDAINEIQKIRRWTLAYGVDSSVTTTPGNSQYAIPSGIDPIDNLYYLDASGYPQIIENYTNIQLQLRMGSSNPGSTVPNGAPKYFSFGIVAPTSAPPGQLAGQRSIQLYPAPDNAGPSSGNYNLIFEGYQQLTSVPIIETTGTTVGTTTITTPQTSYLVANGLTTGTPFVPVSIRGAGFPQNAAVNDDHVTTLTAAGITAPSTTFLVNVAPPTNVTNAQMFLWSQNWLIREYPKVLEFAVEREVATRLSSDYQKWEARYQHELELMEDAELDRSKLLEVWLTYTPGQRVPQLRRLDTLLGWDIRGSSI